MKDMSDIRQLKRDLRRIMQIRRAEAFAKNPDAPLKLRDVFLKSVSLPPGAVSFYMARANEMNPAPLAEALREENHCLCLPVVTGKGVPLIFRTYTPGDPLTGGVMDIPEPSLHAPAVEPDILLVPLLAFDREGYRLGYGGGYYDRTLNNLRKHKKILAIGIAFSCQEVPAVPRGMADAKLDKIATEIETFLT